MRRLIKKIENEFKSLIEISKECRIETNDEGNANSEIGSQRCEKSFIDINIGMVCSNYDN